MELVRIEGVQNSGNQAQLFHTIRLPAPRTGLSGCAMCDLGKTRLSQTILWEKHPPTFRGGKSYSREIQSKPEQQLCSRSWCHISHLLFWRLGWAIRVRGRQLRKYTTFRGEFKRNEQFAALENAVGAFLLKTTGLSWRLQDPHPILEAACRACPRSR
jgi:hypothetical protein